MGSAHRAAPVDASLPIHQIRRMERESAIARLERNKASLRALGLARLSLFGSTARGEASPESDVDLAVTLDRSAGIDLQ